jgi:hypothetical protein
MTTTLRQATPGHGDQDAADTANALLRGKPWAQYSEFTGFVCAGLLISVNAQPATLRESAAVNVYPLTIMRSIAMTQHQLQEHTEEDRRIMRQLAIVVGGFIVATAIMAVTVGVIMG